RVLPGASRLAGEHVAGARLEDHLAHLALLARAALEAQARGAPERDADHALERRRVAVPPDRRARWIALHECLHERLRILARELGSANAHGQQPRGHRLAGARLSRVVVVPRPVAEGRATRGLAGH